MHATNWIPLPREGIAPFEHPVDAKWAFESPSPFDVPSHLRALYDDKAGCLQIEFRYPSDEPTVAEITLTPHPHVQIHVGKGTKRVRRISINVRALGMDKKRIVAEAQQSLAPTTHTLTLQSNRMIVGRALEKRGGRMLDLAFA